MIQRRVVVTAKQCEENFHPMEILFTRELLTKHINYHFLSVYFFSISAF